MVEKLVYPPQWNEVWTKYPHGLTIFEAVVDWVNKVNSLVDLTNTTQENVLNFYESIVAEIATLYTNVLPNSVETVLDEWYASGKLADLINLEILGGIQTKVLDIETHLIDLGIYIKADKTGILSASSIINTAIENASNGDTIHFPQGIYSITTPILLTKKVSLIADGVVTLKANSIMDSILICTGFTTYTNVYFDGFYFDANNKADHCIKLDGSPLYAVRTVIENCECRNAVLDGIIIIPPAWTITIKNTLSNSHGRDGLRSIMLTDPGTNQLNHIHVQGCTFNNNVGEGINILGVSITIDSCDIEDNNIGININAVVNSIVYNSFQLNVINNYIEGNRTNQVYASTNTGDGIVLNIEGNYFNSANLGGAVIKCEGVAEAITLNLGKNRFESSTTNVILDGGNCLNSASLIVSDIYLNITKFLNLGVARILVDMFNIIMLPASSSTSPSSNVHETDDLVTKTPKKVEYPVTVDLQLKLLKLIAAKIVTNATDYNITCSVKVFNTLGVVDRSIGYTITGTSNQDWGTYITNDWGNYRIPPEHFVSVSFLVNSHTADRYVVISNVCLSYI